MDDAEIITATDASRSFSELLHRVCYGGQSFIIRKGNRMMARMIPVDAVEKIKQDMQLDIPEAPTAPMPAAIEVTAGEDEYYKALVECLRKNMPEPCE